MPVLRDLKMRISENLVFGSKSFLRQEVRSLIRECTYLYDTPCMFACDLLEVSFSR